MSEEPNKLPPVSYLDAPRPDVNEAFDMETQANPDLKTMDEVWEVLKKKGFFTPNPRPWAIGFRDRGHGHGDYGVMDKFGKVIIENILYENAVLIVDAVNAFVPPPIPEVGKKEE